MPTELQKETYNEIIRLYDHAEGIIDIAESMKERVNPIVDDVEKLIDSIEKNTEILIENFTKYMESGKTLSGVEKMKMEKARKEIDSSIRQFLNN